MGGTTSRFFSVRPRILNGWNNIGRAPSMLSVTEADMEFPVGLIKGSSFFVMAGHSRPKDGVASARLCPGHPRSYVWSV
jgi:hypothetical protein